MLAGVFFANVDFPEGLLPLHALLKLSNLCRVNLMLVSMFGEGQVPGLSTELIQLGLSALTTRGQMCPLVIDVQVYSNYMQGMEGLLAEDVIMMLPEHDLRYPSWVDKELAAFKQAWESIRDMFLARCDSQGCNVTIQYRLGRDL